MIYQAKTNRSKGKASFLGFSGDLWQWDSHVKSPLFVSPVGAMKSMGMLCEEVN